jgi:PAS domain S-box-containing protein
MQHNKFTNTQVVAASLALAAIIFLIDISVPLGVAGGVPYVAVVLFSLWSPRKNLVLYAALLCAFLTIIGYFLSPAGGEFWKVFANRFIALFAIWVTALLGMAHKRAEAELRRFNDILEERVEQRTDELVKERDRASQFLGIAGVMFVAINASGEVTLINEKGCEVLGYSEGEILGKNWFENFLPERIRAEILPLSKQLLSGKLELIKYHENPVLTKSGEERLIAWHNSLIKDKLGNVTGHLSSGEDITERRRSEEAIVESEEKFSSLFKNMLNGFAYHKIVVDKDNRPVDYIFLEVNEYFEALTGLKSEDIIGRKVTEALPGIENSDFDWIGEYGKIALEGGELRFEQYFEPLDKWYSIFAFRNKPGHFAAVFEDITKRKRSEESLRESESLLAEAQKIAHLGHWKLNAETQEITGSDEFFRIFGISREEADLATFIEVVHPDDRARDVEAITRGMEKGENWTIEHRLICKDGTEKSVYAVGQARVDETGKVIELVGTIQDITERKRAEEALAESEERFALAMQGANDGLWDWNLLTNELYFSLRWKSMLGYAKNELEDTYETWERLVHPDDLEEAKQTIDDYLTGATGKYEVEFRMEHKDGSWVNILSRGFAVRSQVDGKPLRFVGTHVDITGRKEAEEEMGALTTRYQAMLTAVPDIIMEVDANKVYRWGNHAAHEFFGEGIIGKEASYYFEGEQKTYNVVQPLFHGVEDIIYLESWQRRKDNVPRLLAWWCRVLKDEDGQVVGALSTARDITEQKQAEQELVKSENRFRGVFESRMIGNIFWDMDGTITDANDAFLKMVRYTKEDVLAGKLSWADMTPPEFKAQDEKALQEIVETGVMVPIEKEFFCKDGSRIPVLLGAASLPGSTEGGVAYVIDITERKRAEAELRAQDERFRILSNATFEGIVFSKNGICIDANQQFADIFGYTLEEIFGMSVMELAHPDYREMLKSKIESASEETYECKVVCKDGSTKSVDVHAQMMVIKGETIRATAIKDITERKMAEAELRAQDERFRSVLENTPTIIFIKDIDSRYLYVNNNWEDVFHVSRENVVGKLDTELFPQDVAEAVRINDLKVLEADKPLEFEELVPHDDGIHTYISIKFPLYDSLGNVESICGIATDITERTRLEQESLKAQKLESVGVLAGGIAHDFNNLLTGIIGNLSLVENMVEKGGGVYEKLQDVEKAALKASSLTQQLLTFSKGGQPIKSIVSIGELLRNTARFALRGSNVKCICCPTPDDLWNVDADEGQLSQVINNLTINADQAMPDGGELKVCAENYIIEQRIDLPLPVGRYVKVTFADNGTGIHKDFLPKVFDPYFTTKQKGSGLGLASSYSVIKRHGGHMGVSSELGVGTTFSLYLPAATESAESGEGAAPNAQEEAVSASVGGRILVMDDEEIIRDVATELLIHFGYEVATAEDGEEAVRMYEEAMEAGEPFGLVIIDITIPGGVGGKEAIKMLHEVDPNVKAIVSSGYSNDPIMSDFKEYGFVDCVAKPYRVTTLGEKVARAFKGGGG